MNVKDRAYNRRCREGARSSPDWRMRSASEDVRDNTTRTERGPLGAGDDDAGRESHTGAAFSLCQSWSSKGGANAEAERGHGGISLNPGGPAEGSDSNWTVPAA